MSLNLRHRIVSAIARFLKVDYYDNPTILEDDPSKVYVWKVDTPEDVSEFSEYLSHAYVKNSGQEPKAMHIVVADVDEIKDIDKNEFITKIKPWIKAQGDG